MRARKTTASSSATPATASITRGEGHSFKQRFNGSRASALPIRPRAQAAAIEISRSRSSSKSPSAATISGPARTQSHAGARTAGSECRSSRSANRRGNFTPSCDAALTATASVGPWTISLTIIWATDRAASGPPMAARASSAAACSGTLQSAPKPTKRLHRATSAVTAPLSRRLPVSAASAQPSTSPAPGRAAINAASDKLPGARRGVVAAPFEGASIDARSANRSSWTQSVMLAKLSRSSSQFNSFCGPSAKYAQLFRARDGSAVTVRSGFRWATVGRNRDAVQDADESISAVSGLGRRRRFSDAAQRNSSCDGDRRHRAEILPVLLRAPTP